MLRSLTTTHNCLKWVLPLYCTIFIDFRIIKIFDIIHGRFLYQTLSSDLLIVAIGLLVQNIHGVISLFVFIVNWESLLILFPDFVLNVIDLFIAHDHFYRNWLGPPNVFFTNMLYSVHVGDYLIIGRCVLILTTDLRWGYLPTRLRAAKSRRLEWFVVRRWCPVILVFENV